MRLIDENGKNLGEIETPKALDLAKSKGLDLVEVSPNTRPPVCKIMSWAKFKYELSKRQKASSKGKSPSLKEMRFSPFTGEGDIAHKLKRVKEFLGKKHPVKLTIFIKGRVMRDQIEKQMSHILDGLKGEYVTDQSPRFMGRNFYLLVYPAKSSNKEKENDNDKEK